MFLEFTNPLNESPLVFPALECFHILGFALSVGTIAMVDFRLLGMGMRRESASEIAKDMAPWTLFGIASMLISGPLLFYSDPDMYYLNRSFQIKMVLLVLAIVFHYTTHRKVIQSGGTPFANTMVASVSLALWIGVIFCGIFIAFI